MAKMKMNFELEHLDYRGNCSVSIMVNGDKKKTKIGIVDANGGAPMYLKGKNLERFAVNILKAIGSKKLKIV